MTRMSILAGCVSALALTTPVLAASDGGVEIGTLKCEQSDRTNLIVWSEAEYVCTFDTLSGKSEVYRGEIDKVGLDLTVDKIETMSWTVVAPTDNADPGALEGTYAGASADATVGVGGGARVLVGGGENGFTLQPVSLSGQEGVGVAAGIETFKLTLMAD